VTQAEWKSAGVPLPPGLARAEDQLPVHGVSWFEASRFAQMLGFRLPTGDEWELAAWGGDGAADGMGVGPRHANVLVTPEGGLDARMLPASALEPLPTGFRQMFGNIWEWCADPESPDSAHRLRMGGSYRSRLEECLSRQRSYLDGHRSAYSLIGFRVAYTAP
jgi:formylglycine-generating enzyme required for sulfatase activity